MGINVKFTCQCTMKSLIIILPFLALAASHHPKLIPYVLNPAGIGGIYKGPDSETIIKGPDGSVITSEQIGGAVEIDNGPAPLLVKRPVLHTVPAGALVINHGHGYGYGHGHGHLVNDLVLSSHVSPGVVTSGGASAGLIHADGASAGLIRSGGASAGLIHAGGASAGSIHAGGASAGSIHAGPVSSGSIHSGPVSPGLVSTGGPLVHSHLNLGPKVISGSPALINTGPALFDGPVIRPSLAPRPVILSEAPIVVDDVKDPKIVEEHVIVGHKVITVPKQVEENRDLIGPSGTISTRGDDAVISGPASITVKGDGVVTDIDKQPDIHVKAVEIKPVVNTPLVINPRPVVLKERPVLLNSPPLVHHSSNIVPLGKPVYEGRAPIITAPLGPIYPVHSPLINNAIVQGNLFPHYAPAYTL